MIGILNSPRPSTLWWLVVSHYDHLGVKGRKLYHGADDNASDIAAMLQLADYAVANHKLFQETNLMFVVMNAEEPDSMVAMPWTRFSISKWSYHTSNR